MYVLMHVSLDLQRSKKKRKKKKAKSDDIAHQLRIQDCEVLAMYLQASANEAKLDIT